MNLISYIRDEASSPENKNLYSIAWTGKQLFNLALLFTVLKCLLVCKKCNKYYYIMYECSKGFKLRNRSVNLAAEGKYVL